MIRTTILVRLILVFALCVALPCCGRVDVGVGATDPTIEQVKLIDGFISGYSPQEMRPIQVPAKTNADFFRAVHTSYPEYDIFEVIERRGFLFLCFRVKTDQKVGDAVNLLNAVIIDKKTNTHLIQALSKS